MKISTKYFLLIICLCGIKICLCQEKYEYYTLEKHGNYAVKLELNDSGTFHYSFMSPCSFPTYTNGKWYGSGDTIILNSTIFDFVTYFGEIKTTSNKGNNLKVSIFSINLVEINRIPNLEFIIFTESGKYQCSSDSLGNYYIDNVSEIDSILLPNLIGLTSSRILLRNQSPNEIELYLDINRINLFIEDKRIVNRMEFFKEKWIRKSDTLINLEDESLFLIKRRN